MIGDSLSKMDIKTSNVLKYTFMIIPFKINERIICDNVVNSGFFEYVDHKRIKYDRLYKHVAANIYEENPSRTIYDFWVNMKNALPEYYQKVLTFEVKDNEKKSYSTSGYIKDIFAYYFVNGIGFIVINFVYDELTTINVMEEVVNKLKKINRVQDNATFEIKDGDKIIDLFSLINKIKENLNPNCDLFFQHSNKKYVSAILLNSFTFFDKPNETDILHHLECLKRSQGDSYGTFEELGDKHLRPFKNMYWGFSTQGIANVNYNDKTVGNFEFYKKFYKNVKREYLLMMLLVLNQEYTLLDYCQKFSSTDDDLPDNEDLNRLYSFKINSTFTTVSHLEHYREFYSKYFKELGVQDILEEVNNKQNSIYLTNKNRLADKKAQKDKNINRFTKVLSVILSIFGITGLINNVASLIVRDNAIEIYYDLCVSSQKKYSEFFHKRI